MDESGCAEGLEHIILPLRTLGISLDELQRRRFVRFCAFLLTANRQTNLTAIKTPDGVMKTLMLDSLTAVLGLPRGLLDPRAYPTPTVVDVGSGAGIPGIPLKIVFPHWSLALVESIGKKARFLRQAVDDLDLTGTTVLQARAEELGAAGEWRDAADLCLARAVSRLASLLELCAPLTAAGGLLIFPKSGDIEAEIDDAGPAQRAVKVALREVVPVPRGLGLGPGRAIVVYQKLAPTPAGYPRRTGLATSRPIGTRPGAGAEMPRGPGEQGRSEQPRRPAER